MQMHESKTSSTRSNSASSTVKLPYPHSSSAGGTGRATSTSSATGNPNINIAASGAGVGTSSPFNQQPTNTTNNNNSNTTEKHKSKKKTKSDKQHIPAATASTNDDKKAAMSNLSSYSLIDDDHIDDQETINVGNLIIDLESDLEKEKFENEQANSVLTNETESKCNTNITHTPSSTSPSNVPSSSVTSKSSSNSNNISCNNNNNSNLKSMNHSIESKSGGKSNQRVTNKQQKDLSGTTSNQSNVTNNNGHVSTRTVFKTSADERGELKMKITRETKPTKSDFKASTSPNQRSPSGSYNTGPGGNNSLSVASQSHDCDVSDTTLSLTGISSTKECGTSTSIGTITEPECLGPCEPGTSVNLEGIVWQETDGGILVVNVTWRGKTYVGALLDCTRHDWAPPRLCDSPASDIDAKTSKGVRAKRIVTRSNGIGLDEKNLLQTTGKLRNGKGRRIPSAGDSTSCNKKQRETSEKATENPSAQTESNTPHASTNSECAIVPMKIDATSNAQQEPTALNNTVSEESGPISPMLIGCTEPNCSKKFRNMNGLLYHQSHAHSAENDPNTNEDCSSSDTKDKSASTVIDEQPTDNLSSPNPPSDIAESTRNELKSNHDTDRDTLSQHPMQNTPQPHGQKRERTSSPEFPSKLSHKLHNEAGPHTTISENRTSRNESPRITNVAYSRPPDSDRRQSSSSSNPPNFRGLETHKSTHNQPRHHPHENYGSANVSVDHQSSSSSSFQTSKTNQQSSKHPIQPPPPLPATTEEGMKPSGTSTGPPPAPHQANCYFNPTFLSNTFNSYGLPPYFPRHMYDPLVPPNVPTSNAAFLTRFMNNMRVPPPPDSPSRLLSPSMRVGPPNVPTSHPMPNMSPLSNPSLPPGPLPSVPPLPMLAGTANLRMPSQGDPLMPPSSQPPFLPPTGLNPALGLPGIGNPLGPMGGPQLPSLVDDSLAKQFPRRFN